MEDIYLQIAQSKTSQGGNYIKDGKYLHAVERLLLEKKHGGKHWFIAELQVVESSPQAVHPTERNAEERDLDLPPNPAGSSVSFLVPLDTDWGPGVVKGFLCALDGTDPAELNQNNTEGLKAFASLLQAATDKKTNALRGALIRCETYRKQTRDGKRSGMWGTRERWETVNQTPEEVAERRRKLDAGERLA